MSEDLKNYQDRLNQKSKSVGGCGCLIISILFWGGICIFLITLLIGFISSWF